MKWTKYTTPSHGYLQIPIEEIQRFGLENQISAFSYTKNEYMYLEEDRDVRVFLSARAKVGETDYHYVDINITEEKFCELSGKPL